MPWTSDTLRPLFAELVPVLETLDVDSLKRIGAQISPEAVALVEQRAKWNPAAKTALAVSGPQVSAKWLNYFGVSAENAPEITLGIALLSIFAGRVILKRELRALANEAKNRRDAEAQRNQPVKKLEVS